MKAFKQVQILDIFISSVKLLDPKDRLKIFTVVAIHIFLGLFDVVGVLLIGLMGSLAVSGISFREPGDRVSLVLTTLRMENLELQNQIGILGIIASLTLISKSFISLYLSKRVLIYLSIRSAGISRKLIFSLLGQSITRVRQSSVQNTIYALTSGVQTVTVGVLGTSLILIGDTFLIIVFMVTMFVVDTSMALMTLTLYISVAMLLYYFMNNRAQNLGSRISQLDISTAEAIAEVVGGYRELLVKNRRGYYAEQIGDLRLDISDAQARLSLLGVISKYIMELALVIGGLIVGSVLFLTQASTRAVALIGVFLMASTRIAPAVLRIYTGFVAIKTNIGMAAPALKLVDEYLHKPIDELEIKSDTGKLRTLTHKDFVGEIIIRNLNFSYGQDSKYALDQINLEIHPGEFLGVVGQSGAGKSTFVDLILGVLEPGSGSIKISGLNPLECFKRFPGAVAYVPQDSAMFNGTVKENVCLGFDAEQVSDDEVIEILRRLALDEVMDWEKGIDSIVGERGFRLSGGQRQRLGIARALFTNPKVIILDESTSSLDSNTESIVTDYLISLAGNMTLIVIAHRLSTIFNADRILYLDKGKMQGVGTFKELEKSCPGFAHQVAKSRF